MDVLLLHQDETESGYSRYSLVREAGGPVVVRHEWRRDGDCGMTDIAIDKFLSEGPRPALENFLAYMRTYAAKD